MDAKGFRQAGESVEDRRRKRWYKDNPKKTREADLGEDDDVVADRIERRNANIEKDPELAKAVKQDAEDSATNEESQLAREKLTSKELRKAEGDDSETSTADAVRGRRKARNRRALDEDVAILADLSNMDDTPTRAERWYGNSQIIGDANNGQ